LAQEPRSPWGALSGYPPKPAAGAMIADSCIASAIVPANTVIVTRLALPAGTRYNTSGLERPPLWPVLTCPRMAGFDVSTEEHATKIDVRIIDFVGTVLHAHSCSPEQEAKTRIARRESSRGVNPSDPQTGRRARPYGPVSFRAHTNIGLPGEIQ
jgi:hypothetical protein